MKEARTASILQRVPVILAVTAASYGMVGPHQANRNGHAPGKVVSAQAAAQPALRAPVTR